MREIKFRAKDTLERNWYIGSYMFTNDNTNNPFRRGPFKESHRIIFYSSCDWNMGGWNDVEIDPSTLGQYTELEDENGKEIYEGDIVDWTFFYNRIGPNGGATETDIQLRGVIKWGKAGFIFEVWRNDFENAGWYGISDLNFDPASDIEVIGNIYDNPELLTK